MTLHVEYAERGKDYGILFIFSLSCEYIQFEHVRIHVIYRGNQAEYGIHILVVAPQEYVNTYSTRRPVTLCAFRTQVHNLVRPSAEILRNPRRMEMLRRFRVMLR